ncbi:MAG: CBS domain-containing protein [Steroidobacteraceae bacterium]
MRIGDLCSREFHVVEPDKPLLEAVREMHRQHVGALVVVTWHDAAARPVGIVTDRDVMRGEITHHADVFSLTVADVMSGNLLTLAESCELADGIAQLRRRGVRRAPVVDERGDLLGIVSLDDLLPAVADELVGLAKLIGRQAGRER